MDGVLVGAGSLWPVNSVFPCQKLTHGVRFARESDGRHHHVFDASSFFKLVSTRQSPLASKRRK
jgi:hypothetical protein